MIAVAVVLCCLALFVLVCKHLEDVVNRVAKWSRKADQRISSLEIHEGDQDQALVCHDSRLDRQEKLIRLTRKDVEELGKDVGWDDNDRKTQVLKLPDPPKDES